MLWLVAPHAGIEPENVQQEEEETGMCECWALWLSISSTSVISFLRPSLVCSRSRRRCSRSASSWNLGRCLTGHKNWMVDTTELHGIASIQYSIEVSSCSVIKCCIICAYYRVTLECIVRKWYLLWRYIHMRMHVRIYVVLWVGGAPVCSIFSTCCATMCHLIRMVLQ